MLNCLFHLTREAGKLPLPELALNYSLGKNPHANAALKIKHLLDLLAILGFGAEIEFRDLSYSPSIPSVTELRLSGIQIERGNVQ